jgi:hypothetical protein
VDPPIKNDLDVARVSVSWRKADHNLKTTLHKIIIYFNYREGLWATLITFDNNFLNKYQINLKTRNIYIYNYAMMLYALFLIFSQK